MEITAIEMDPTKNVYGENNVEDDNTERYSSFQLVDEPNRLPLKGDKRTEETGPFSCTVKQETLSVEIKEEVTDESCTDLAFQHEQNRMRSQDEGYRKENVNSLFVLKLEDKDCEQTAAGSIVPLKEEPLTFYDTETEVETPSHEQVDVHFEFEFKVKTHPDQEDRKQRLRRGRTPKYAYMSESESTFSEEEPKVFSSHGKKRRKARTPGAAKRPKRLQTKGFEKSSTNIMEESRASDSDMEDTSFHPNEKKGRIRVSAAVDGLKSSKTCPVCQKTFSRTDSLTCHMRVHTGDRPYVCQFCSASYKVSSHLKAHLNSKHTKAASYPCRKCEKQFAYSTARHRHEKACGKDLSERMAFKCSKCDKEFVTAQGHERHEKKCDPSTKKVTEVDSDEGNNDLPFNCTECSKTFGTSLALDRHKRFVCGKPVQKGRYVCVECGKEFRERHVYISHTRRHVGEKPYKCSQCDACFFDNRGLGRHIKRHLMKSESEKFKTVKRSADYPLEKRFKCSLCGKAFRREENLTRHEMRVHLGMKLHKCSECEHDFCTKEALSRHIRRIHRKELKFQCHLCSARFFDSHGLKMHLRRHELQPDKQLRKSGPLSYSCRYCQKKISRKDFSTHLKEEHPGVSLYLAFQKETVKCDICFKTLANKRTLRLHKFSHLGLRPFKCDKCDKSFKLRAGLMLHQRKHTDYRPHACPECGQTFRWAGSVKYHMQTRHNLLLSQEDKDKAFLCPECGKVFKRKICLTTHMKLHADVYPHACPECGKRFAIMSRLKIHMTVHEGPKPFVCDTCGAGFYYQYLLNEHVGKMHDPSLEKRWLCDECGKSYSKKSYVILHKKLHAKYPGGKIPKRGRRPGTRVLHRRPTLNLALQPSNVCEVIEVSSSPEPFILRQDIGRSFMYPTSETNGIRDTEVMERKPASNFADDPLLYPIPEERRPQGSDEMERKPESKQESERFPNLMSEVDSSQKLGATARKPESGFSVDNIIYRVLETSKTHTSEKTESQQKVTVSNIKTEEAFTVPDSSQQ